MTMSSDGIDLDFRPKAYFWPIAAETHVLATIKGAARRAEAARLIAAGAFDKLDNFLAASALSEEDRRSWGRIHPSLMGGEYLPDRAETEIEIARINIASTTSDVTSVYARRQGKRIAYRVVDEYGGDTLSAVTRRTSIRPLTLGELRQFFLTAWRLDEVLQMNDLDREGAHDFVRPSSAFYPQFSQLIRLRIDEWIPIAEADEVHS
jgi:hypothetical protein